jgi:hypothetical protein
VLLLRDDRALELGAGRGKPVRPIRDADVIRERIRRAVATYFCDGAARREYAMPLARYSASGRPPAVAALRKSR